VKEFIGNNLGFDRVDQQVVAFMTAFIGRVVENDMKQGVSRRKSAASAVRPQGSHSSSWFAGCRYTVDLHGCDVQATPLDSEHDVDVVRVTSSVREV